MKKMVMVLMAVIAMVIFAGYANPNTAYADDNETEVVEEIVVPESKKLYREFTFTEELTKDDGFMDFIRNISTDYMKMVINGEIDSFTFGTAKDGRLYVETYVAGRLGIMGTTTRTYTDFYIK